MQTQERKFQPDEQLVWLTLETGNTPTRRMVEFEKFVTGCEPNDRHAVIQWAGTRYTVPVRELSRIEPVSNIPIYHDAPIRAPQPPKPASLEYLQRQLGLRRTELQAAHQAAQQAREAVSYAQQLVDRARGEHTAAQAQLQELEGHARSESIKLEKSIRANQPPPPPEPHGLDRAAILHRVAATSSILEKLSGELRTAETRFTEAQSHLRQVALQVVTLHFEQAVTNFAVDQQALMERKASLLRAATVWFPNVGKPMPVSDGASQTLTVPFDPDKLRFLGSDTVTKQFENLFSRLLADPAAGLGDEPVTKDTQEAA
jgi:hypothetical protein